MLENWSYVSKKPSLKPVVSKHDKREGAEPDEPKAYIGIGKPVLS